MESDEAGCLTQSLKPDWGTDCYSAAEGRAGPWALCMQLPLHSQKHGFSQPGFSIDVLLWVLDNECHSRLQGPGCQASLYTWSVDICSATQEVMLCPEVG